MIKINIICIAHYSFSSWASYCLYCC